ncbi:zinc finger SWIM domain-containing protein 7-like [Ostrea edulis]|uniref:zinc finger SWIM domain-containing protein 7-like n=1 Tax=Ostrea edulis TaxID=37623 RepID=UPI0024AF9AC0|nr:zinc finger SWIM domain-containing protein 7-like [Ostrea edulis]XP_056001851.1 zinc finger SWIM domain-containing protein 7-like [Ostrea edulis]XP_056001854.1 zinc finger SWIM domain-containing protein 7-like [Ostrea edulis]XP_056001859.1 zinc finger SWIM domain-containing protein 7-like [Ostrea edulis]
MDPARRKVQEVADQLLAEVNTAYNKTGKLNDELLSALNFVFQAPLLPALDILDNRGVTAISCPSGRKVYQVLGTSGTPYICLPSSKYCSCPAYRYSVLLKNDHLLCKHVLAIRLAEAMNLTKSQGVTDLEMTNLVKNLE